MSGPVVLGIAGSPRRGGNSDALLDACLAGAEEAGARVERVTPSALDIRPCRGCNACAKTGECIQRDDMRSVYGLIDAASAIAVASPVYFAGVPAAMKALIDRMQPYWARRYVLGQAVPSKRPGALLLVRGGGDPYGFTGAEHNVRSAFAVIGVRVAAEEYVTGVDAAGEITAFADVLERAHAHGRALVAGPGRQDE